MDNQKRMELIEDMLEVEPDSLNPEMKLSEIENWDSMAQLSLIVMLDEECGKRITVDDLKKLETIQDILNLMQ